MLFDGNEKKKKKKQMESDKDGSSCLLDGFNFVDYVLYIYLFKKCIKCDRY